MKKMIAIVGPTASGKSALAFLLAEKFGGEVVNADARQVYRGLDIGTAKDVGRPVHLVDIVDASEEMTVAEYQKRAFEVIEDILRCGKLPILVGGGGLYVSSVVDGRSFPDVKPHPMFRMIANALPLCLLVWLLKRCDAERASTVDLKNPRRVVRALEVHVFSMGHLNSGRQLSVPSDFAHEVLQIGLFVPRDALYRRIETRVIEMVQQGLFEEVKQLLDSGVSPRSPAMSGIGYKEVIESIEGRTTKEEAEREIQKNTRRLAKRQMTWFKRDARIKWVSSEEEAVRLTEAFLQ